jgi:hypothetical protein
VGGTGVLVGIGSGVMVLVGLKTMTSAESVREESVEFHMRSNQQTHQEEENCSFHGFFLISENDTGSETLTAFLQLII